jgi:cytochrome P450
MTIESIAHLKTARRYLTSVLLNLPVNTSETTVATLLVMLDHFADHPDEYQQLTHGITNTRQNSRL